MNTIAKYLQEIKSDINFERAVNDSDEITPKTTELTREKLEKSIDWPN